MPPGYVKTIHDEILYEYVFLIFQYSDWFLDAANRAILLLKEVKEKLAN